ncbi:MAG: sugar ABC transporter permease [Chloroflexi bacterium]|nr:sugar ABC transporter permease [Chloroflexota bacterium]
MDVPAPKPSLAPPPGKTGGKNRWTESLRAWAYILPAGLLMLAITFFPQAYQGWMAFTDYRLANLRFNVFDQGTWEKFAPPLVGFDNFVKVLTSNLAIENYDFVRLLKFNIAWTVSNVFFHVLLGIVIALALNSKNLLGRRFYRAVFVLPWAIPGLIIAFTWRNMFDRRFGAINQIIGRFNAAFGTAFPTDNRWLDATEPPAGGNIGLALASVVLVPLLLWGLNALFRARLPFWLKLLPLPVIAWAFVELLNMYRDSPMAFWAVLITNIWLGWPFMTVIATGALQSIPEELYEAARMDGATGWQQLVNITLPLLRPAMIPAVMVGTIWTFNNFNVIYFITQGGPFGRTELLVTQAYKLVFTQRLYGVAAAFSIVVFFVLLIITILQNRVTRATEAYYE